MDWVDFVDGSGLVVYLTGYGGERSRKGESKPGTLAALVQAMDATLLDIRHVPWSKAPCWQKGSLQALLGDRYRHLPALGNANYRGQFGEGYRIVDLRHGLEQVLCCERTPILLCGCEDYESCHRSYVALFLRGYVEDIVEINHWSAMIEKVRARAHS